MVGGNEKNAPPADGFKAWYPSTKRVAEEAVLAANGPALATVALRPRLIWGPGDNQLLPRLVDRARSGRLRFVGDGQNKIDTTYIDNAAQAHLDAFDALHGKPDARCAGDGHRFEFTRSNQPSPRHSRRDGKSDTIASRASPMNSSLPSSSSTRWTTSSACTTAMRS